MIGQERRLLVVEDEPLTSGLLVEVLRAQGFEVAAAPDVLQARGQIELFDPDAVLLDISLGDGPSGLDFAHALHERRPDIAIVFLTRFPDLRTAGLSREDLPPGSGFLRKDLVRDAAHLVDAIDAVLNDRPEGVRHDRTEVEKPLEGLSAKQLDVLRLMAAGYTNEHIADERGVAVSTVERWCVEIFRELGITGADVNRRVEAVRQYIAVVGIPGRASQ